MADFPPEAASGIRTDDDFVATGDAERLRRELTEARARAVESDAFAGRVAHDLQAPARQVAALAELLPAELGDVPDGAAEVLRLLVDSGHRLAGLTSALLAYTRLGTAEVVPGPVDTEAAVTAALSDRAADIDAAGGRVTMERPLAAVVATDRLLREIVGHLVQNACRHGRVPDLRITVSSRPVSGAVEVRVSDNGEGMVPEHRERAFEPLRRLAATEGFGLGLAMVRRAAGRLGGTVRLESGPGGRGTSAVVRLPDPAEPPAAGAP